MAQLGVAFNAQEHDTEQRDYENLPDGIYDLEVVVAELKENGNNIGIKMQYSVIEPAEYENRKVFGFINVQHSNADAQRIGQQELARLCRACGLATVNDTDELRLIRFRAKIGMGKPSKDGQYAARNEIKRFYYPDEGDLPPLSVDAPAANDNKPAARQQQAAPAQASKPAGTRPWGAK